MTDFEGWLRKGLGRAAVFLQNNNAKPYRYELLYACTRDVTFLCEPSRAPYLLDLLAIAGDGQFYRDGILSAIRSDDERMDLGQAFQIASTFAATGDHEMKRAMRRAFERRGFANAGLSAAEELVRLEGTEGLLLVAKSFGQIVPDDRPWQFGRLIETLEEHHGKQPLPLGLGRFVREWQDYEEYWKRERQKQPESHQSYETLKRSLTPSGAMAWARTAEELALAAQDLRLETDDERLVAYLRMFRNHVFPKPIERLLDLARVENDDVALAALVALSNVVDSRVRSLGLDFMTGLKWRGFAVRLLIRNAEPGDYQILERLLGEAIDRNVYHCVGIDVRAFVKAHRSEEAERSLLLLYENGPCSLCRHGAVEELIAINRFPQWMIEECRYDAYAETRKLAIAAVSSGR
jgi:hypothetical protein